MTAAWMNIKDRLRQLVELIDDDEESLDEAIDYLRWLASDEPEELTPEEWKEVRKAEKEISEGKGVRLEDLKREFGL